MKAVQGQKKNQRIGKAGVAVAIALIFSATFSGDIQTFVEGEVAKSEGEVKPSPAPKLASSAVPEGLDSAKQPAPEAQTSVVPESTQKVEVAALHAPNPAQVVLPSTPASAPVFVKPATAVVQEKRVPKVEVKPREAAPAPVLRAAAPPQVVYQADLPPVPAFAPPQAAPEKPLKFSAPAKAVREMPRSEAKAEPKTEAISATGLAQTPAAPQGVYSLNTASTQVGATAPSVTNATNAPEKPAAKPAPTVKTQAGDKAVLAMPDGTTRVVTLGESVPGYGVVNKLTKNEVIFGASK